MVEVVMVGSLSFGRVLKARLCRLKQRRAVNCLTAHVRVTVRYRARLLPAVTAQCASTLPLGHSRSVAHVISTFALPVVLATRHLSPAAPCVWRGMSVALPRILGSEHARTSVCLRVVSIFYIGPDDASVGTGSYSMEREPGSSVRILTNPASARLTAGGQRMKGACGTWAASATADGRSYPFRECLACRMRCIPTA